MSADVGLRKTMTEARHATAVHEAGHAVVSYLLGRRVKYLVLFDDQRGETVTDSSFDDESLTYHDRHDPKEDPQSRHIQDDLRFDMAIALAGAITQLDLCGDKTLIKSEFDRDVQRAKCGAAHIHRALDLHRGLSTPHCGHPWYCEFCGAYLEEMTSRVREILAKQLVRDSIKALAADKLEGLENSVQRDGSEVENFFLTKGLTAGSEIDSLPQVPEADLDLETRFPRSHRDRSTQMN